MYQQNIIIDTDKKNVSNSLHKISKLSRLRQDQNIM